jgi:hypothetical protein
MRRWLIGCVVGVAALVAAFWAGHVTAPSKLVEARVITTSDGEQTKAANSQTTAKTEDTSRRYTKRTETRPDGTSVTTETSEAKAVTKATAKAVASTERIQWRTKTDVQYRAKIVDKPIRANWGVGAHVGVDISGGKHYSLDVSRRLFGGLWISAVVDPKARAVLGGLRVQW